MHPAGNLHGHLRSCPHKLTACIDLVVSEFNCSLPGIEPICKQLEIPMLCLDDVAKKDARLVAYQAGKGEEAAAPIAAVAIASFLRRGKAGKRTNPMKDHGVQEAIAGVTESTLKEALGGSKKLITRDILVLSAGCT